ncbi:MAG: tetratricopeptide repeat protein, partial [Cyanobacteria bacterium P01_H01_bin.130]
RVNAIRDLTQVYDRFAQVSRMLAYAAEDKDETVQRTAKWALGKLEALRGATETGEPGDEMGAGIGASGGLSVGDADGMVLLAQARQAYETKDYGQAAVIVKEAIAQEPSHPQVHLLAAEVAIAQEQPVKAIVSEQRARDCAWDRGDATTATMIQEGWLSRELDPDRAALCHAQGVQALRASQVEDALGLLDEALVCNPYDPEIYMARARVLRQQGKLGEACAHWQKAQEIYLELGDVKALKGVQQLLQKFG